MKTNLKIFLLVFVFASCSNSTNEPIDPINVDNTLENKKPTGSSANDLLSNDEFKSLIVELVYVKNHEPEEATIDNLQQFLEATLNKSIGISITTREIESHGDGPFTNLEISEIEDSERTNYNTGDQIAVFALFIDAESAENTSSETVLGTAYRNTSFVIYEKAIKGFSDESLEPDRAILETTVLLHEFGHLLGLTNFGSSMQTPHEDAVHSKHCDVENCLMYWAVDSSEGLANLVSGGLVPNLDSQCIADLIGNGGK